ITRINLTNAGTDVNGLTLTALIAKRDCLQKRVRAMRRFLGTASQTAMRSRGSEIIVKSTVPVRELQKSVDDLSKTLRETDTAIQAANWSTELL
ncbi:MAG: DIP1984 family protein, partial [Clostridia bacterium]|nr:DIP1984 family protein [Clostridia bacterium]